MVKLDAVDDNQNLQLLKAVAQAWLAHAADANPTNEFAARRAARSHLLRPSRFKLEAAAAAAAAAEDSSWDFSRSLWDSYELITIAKQLEACNLGLDQPMPSPPVSGGGQRQGKRRRESKNSLRSLFSKTSSRRFDERDVSDADWAGDPDSRRSTSSYCSYLGDTIISWTVKKQHAVARSSTESEYRALAALTTDIIWLRRLLSEFGIDQAEPTEIFYDNTSAIALANNLVFHARTKHIEIDQKYIREHLQQNNVRLIPISTIDQTADIFTKALSTQRFVTLRNKLTVSDDPLACGRMLKCTHK